MIGKTQCAALAVILLCTACFNVFYRLNDGIVASWDEARHGVSALEMIESGNYLVNTYEGEPDYYNAKPVLSFYPVVAGFKLFGKTLLGLRFFSAVAFLLTAAAVALFALRYRGPTFALLAVGIFITSIRLITRHGARTGDADAVFVMLYALSLFSVLAPGRGFHRYLLAAFLAGLAFLSKSFHTAHLAVSLVLLFVADYGVHARAIGRGAVCAALAALPVGLWAYLRMGYDGTSFFEQMLYNDVVRRMSVVVEGHNGGLYYYFIKILQNFPVWLGGLALLLGVSLRCARPLAVKDLPGMFRVRGAVSRRLLLVTAVPFVMLTCSTSKLDWYMYPTFPFLSILLAEAGVCLAGRILRLRPAARPLLAVVLPVLCFIAQEAVTLRNIVLLAAERDRSQEIIRETAQRDPATPVYIFVEAKKNGLRQSLVMASKMYVRKVYLLPGGKKAHDAFSGGEKVLIYDQMQPPPSGT
ncbi:MAG: glycosyltransferase family 39 protein [Desulfovibrio sp.]|jgi:4-amino-4-deoxy-L-arabinose transferase-like glycosyltransferase|nr:glycosyltransferase family 39 protein [Desulfovibrio sp.]